MCRCPDGCLARGHSIPVDHRHANEACVLGSRHAKAWGPDAFGEALPPHQLQLGEASSGILPSRNPGPTSETGERQGRPRDVSGITSFRRQDIGHGPEGVLKLAEEHSDSHLALIPRGHTGSEDYCVEGVTRSTHALTKPLPGGVGGRGGPRAPGDTTDTQRILKDEAQERILKDVYKLFHGISLMIYMYVYM